MTFEELKSELGDWLGVDTNRLSNTTRGFIINLSMRELVRDNDLRFGETRNSINAVAGTAEYDVPTNYSRPYELYYYDSSSGKKCTLSYLTREEFTARFGSNTEQGSPAYWTIWGEKIYVNCPDSSYTLYFDSYCLPTNLADGSPTNTNEFVQYAWEAIFFRALWYTTKNIIEDSRIAIWEKDAERYRLMLVREHARAKSVAKRPVAEEPG